MLFSNLVNMNHASRDDSEIALSIAFRSAIISTIGFLAFSFASLSKIIQAVPLSLESFIKVGIVLIALIFSRREVREGAALANPSHIPFLSTFFFYGITLFLVYLGQIVFIGYQLISNDHIKFLEELRFILGISTFSVGSIVSAFILWHIPYILYFVGLKMLFMIERASPPQE